jgi:MFS family permease
MSTRKRRSGRTLFALGLGHLVDQGEGDSIGVLSPVIQQVWGISYSMIGLLESLRGVVQMVSAPFWGYISDRYSRRKVLFFGTGIWGIWTLLVGLAPDFDTLLILRMISGFGLGCLLPATFSLLGDHFSQEKRGRALGVIGMVGQMGTVFGVIGMGFLATTELWRWGFVLLGAASILSGVLIWFLVDEPPRGAAEPEMAEFVSYELDKKYQARWRDMLLVLKIPTLWAAIIQGVVGTVPWVVMAIYFINWMVKELHFSNDINLDRPLESAPLVFALVVIGVAFSNLMGGFLGDWAEKRSPRYGRTIIGQFSVFAGAPLMYWLLTAGPSMTFGEQISLALLISLIIGWPGRGAKEPMMQAVVLPELRSSAYAMVNVIEGGFAALSSYFAGALADSIGLTNAMILTVPLPWVICGLSFTLFYFTYPKDSRRVRIALSRRRSELELERNREGV